MTDEQKSLMVIDPEVAIIASQRRKQIVAQMREKQVLRPGVEFGVIPGSKKPSLLKPGAERLCAAFGLSPDFETVEAVQIWDGEEPFFFYRKRCRLIHIESGLVVATGSGSCNSREARYRWRWLKASECPPHLNLAGFDKKTSSIVEFDFAIKKGETTGRYGKPEAYWQTFRDAISSGTARKTTRPTRSGDAEAWEIETVVYRVPNDDIFSLVNTIEKMADKRALVAATLIGANASEFFTQDIEDLAEFGGQVSPDDDVVDGTFEEVTGDPATSGSGNGHGHSAQDAWTAFWEAYKQTGFKPTDKDGLQRVLGVTTTYGQDPEEMLARLQAYLAQKAEA